MIDIDLAFLSQDDIGKHSKTPLTDPNFDFTAWKNKHLRASEEVARTWVQDVKAKFGASKDVQFACVGYW